MVRVYLLAKDGRTVTLYRVNPGEISILSLNSLLQNQPFTAFTETESAVAGLGIFSRDRCDTLSITHQELANELGTSREVVSRIHKEFVCRNFSVAVVLQTAVPSQAASVGCAVIV